MKFWKMKTAAVGVLLVALAPAAAYGQSGAEAANLRQDIVKMKVCYENFQKQQGTYCEDWKWLVDQWMQQCNPWVPDQKPDLPDMDETPDVDQTPDLPDVDETPDVDQRPDLPDVDETPDVDQTPDLPDVDQKPDLPDVDQKPGVDQKPDTDQKPNIDQNTGNVSAYAQQVLDLVNKERRAEGLGELTLSSSLSKVAQVKAEDMRDQGYFSHTSPTYGSPFDMMKKFGISYRSAGENIAKGYQTPKAVMNGWMNSSGHRANIMSNNFTEMGLGYCVDGSGSGYWVQMFIKP